MAGHTVKIDFKLKIFEKLLMAISSLVSDALPEIYKETVTDEIFFILRFVGVVSPRV